MTQAEGTFKGADGETIFHRHWLPEQPAKAAVLIAHGFGEHCGRYDHVAHFLNRHGYSVYALDHVGHGKSSGFPALIKRFGDVIGTLKNYLDMVKALEPGKPLFLIGHSMGGLIAAFFLLAYQAELKGCVLSGPAVQSSISPPWYQVLIIKILSFLFPKAGLIALDANLVSRDTQVVSAYRADPLVYTGKIPARTMVQLLGTMEELQSRAGEIHLPILLLHGEADGLTPSTGSQFLNDNISSKDKKLILYPGLYHEIFNEPEQEEVLSDVVAWLDAHQ